MSWVRSPGQSQRQGSATGILLRGCLQAAVRPSEVHDYGIGAKFQVLGASVRASSVAMRGFVHLVCRIRRYLGSNDAHCPSRRGRRATLAPLGQPQDLAESARRSLGQSQVHPLHLTWRRLFETGHEPQPSGDADQPWRRARPSGCCPSHRDRQSLTLPKILSTLDAMGGTCCVGWLIAIQCSTSSRPCEVSRTRSGYSCFAD